jgi:hypothetical protein
MLIKIEHPQIDQQMTRLSADVAASATSSTVENNDGFTTDDYLLFGKIGQEKTEIVKCTSTTGNTTLGHTTGPVFAHSASTPVYLIRFNQAKIYTSTTETETYTLLATVSLDTDEEYTIYDDTEGTTSTWYKVKYYNVVKERYSEYGDPVQGTGYSEESLYSIAQEIAEDFGDPDFKEVSRRMVYRYINAGVRKTVVEVSKAVKDFMRAYKAEAMAGTAEYTVPARMLKLYALRANYAGSAVADSDEVGIFSTKEKLYDQSDYSTSDPHAYWEGDKVGLAPTTNSSGYLFWYYLQAPETMSDVIDTHGLPYGGRDLLVLYGLYRLWKTKNLDKSNSYKTDFKDALPDYIDFVSQQRQVISHPRVEVVFGQELYE